MYFFAPKMIKFSHKDSQQRDGQSLPSLHNIVLFFNLNNPRKKNRSYQGCSTPLQLCFALNITFKEKIFPIKNSIGELAYPITQNKDTRSAA